MKVLVAMLCAMVALVGARPEPPVDQYLPAAYSTTQEDSFAPPSGPSETYGAPSNTYGAPSSAPSNTYGAPSSGPSNIHGAAGRSRASKSSSGSRGQSKSPSRNYGAPAHTAAIFASPASSYGAPSAQHNPAPVYGAPASGGYPSARKSAADDDLSEPAKYEFSYEVQDSPSGNDFMHRENRDGDVAWGSYSVVLPDGRKQIVEYEANQEGYNPKIRYEEAAGGYGRGGKSDGPY